MNSWFAGTWADGDLDLWLLSHIVHSVTVYSPSQLFSMVFFVSSWRAKKKNCLAHVIFVSSCTVFLKGTLYLFSVERLRVGDGHILPLMHFLVFFLKTQLNEGVSFKLNTFWKSFQSQKRSSERLYHPLTQCYSPPYLRTSVCSYCLTLTLSKLSHACKSATTIWVKDCFHSVCTLRCSCSNSPEKPYLLFGPCLLSQYHQLCSFSPGCCRSSALPILETTAVHSLHLSHPPPLSNEELCEATALLLGE